MEFHLGDRVLVRRTYITDSPWVPALFAYEQKEHGPDEERYVIFGGTQFDQCIPYEGNEGLVGFVPEPVVPDIEQFKQFEYLQQVEVNVLEDETWEDARYLRCCPCSDEDDCPHKVLLEEDMDIEFVSDDCIRAKSVSE